jgi:hypothetical protein
MPTPAHHHARWLGSLGIRYAAMAQFQQDPTDPTGVRDLAPQRYAGGPDGSVVRARTRKANAAVQMRLAGATWPEKMIAVSKAREILADHRKLFGLDAPTEVIVHNPSAAELEEWVAGVVALSTTLPPEPDVIAGTWTEPADEPAEHEGENSDADAG